jgi:undecaprenyl-diphosphatase
LAIVGAVVPGSVLLVGIGALVPAGAANLWAILAWAVAGAVAGDGLSYWLGYRYGEIEILPMTTALGIGFCQTLALIPGVSRAGATILGAELLGVDRRIATEFSLYLAIPTMLGATVFDLWKSRAALTVSGIDLIAIGFITAFVVAIPVVRGLIGFVGRHGLVPFAWYRLGLVVVPCSVAGSRRPPFEIAPAFRCETF